MKRRKRRKGWRRKRNISKEEGWEMRKLLYCVR